MAAGGVFFLLSCWWNGSSTLGGGIARHSSLTVCSTTLFYPSDRSAARVDVLDFVLGFGGLGVGCRLWVRIENTLAEMA